jgi:2,3-bisphosphoglycerate-dependent phosphoglycerate mutase
MPKTECLKDVVERIVPYLTKDIAVDMNAGKTVLVTAHGNSIRAIVKHIDCISDEDIAGVNIPTGIPLLYEFDDDFEPIKKGGEYLDPSAAKEAIAAVANQGKK